MLPADTLRYVRIADVPAGNLIYISRGTESHLALRLEHPGNTPFPAALVFHDMAGNERMPLVDRNVGNQRCVDTGLQAKVAWEPPLAILPQNTNEALRPGYLVLVGTQVAVSTFYVGGRGERTYWNLATGAALEIGAIGADPMVFIVGWHLGVKSPMDGSFVKLATYPDDYDSSSPSLTVV